MNLRTWLRRLTKPTAIELAQRKAQLTASYRQGRLDERYALLAELAAEQQAANRALTPNPDYHIGEKLHAYNEAKKLQAYRPIKLLPASSGFPWLADENWLNSKLIPVPPIDVIPAVETDHMPAFVKALHQGKGPVMNYLRTMIVLCLAGH